ncbi:MAG: 2-dehydropantoate 2-reductase [Mogibacterium sp.]|nr:2-dehydropantoate 2-reductase [Mogibacterium sp.]
MKYLVIGAGGTGGAISTFLAKGGKDVSLIARGDNLTAIRDRGMRLTFKKDGVEHTEYVTSIKVYSAEEYEALGEVPDVVFLCTKSYSVESVAPFIERVIDDRTILIPILNGIQMGNFVRRFVSKGRPIDGCIYISARKDGVGGVYLNDGMFRVIFGQEGGFSEEGSQAGVTRSEAEQIAADLRDSNVRVVISDNILRDTLRKFSCIGSLAGAGLYYDDTSKVMQVPGGARDLMCDLVRDVVDLAAAMGVSYDIDLVKKNCDIVDHMSPGSSASLQRDIWDGHESEFESLMVEPIRIGARFGLEMPAFRKVVAEVAPRLGLSFAY